MIIQTVILALAIYLSLVTIVEVCSGGDSGKSTLWGLVSSGLWAHYIVHYLGGWF
jgi:hypothetical protein